jgi:peptidoglycan/LPS O-acetylase OafA/YrhL
VGGIALREISAPRPRLILRFWLRRWWRTLPPYWAALALVFLFAPGLHLPREPWWRYAGFLQNLAWPHPPFFGEAWSLAVEEWFYLLLPAFLWVGAPRNLGRRLAVTLAGFCLLRLAVTLAQDPAWDEGVRKIVLLRLDAILWGVAVAWMARTQGPRLRACALPAAGAGDFCFVLGCAGKMTAWTGDRGRNRNFPTPEKTNPGFITRLIGDWERNSPGTADEI